MGSVSIQVRRTSLSWFNADDVIDPNSPRCSALDEEEVHWNPQGLCFGPAVGYQIPASILQSTGYPQLAGDIARALTILLVLHPVVAALSLVGAATSLFLHSHGMHIISLITTIINSFLSSIVLAADLAIAIIAGQKLPGLTGGIFDVEFGNAMYLAIFGVALSWLGVILLSIPVCGCCGMGEWYHRWETKKFKGRSSDPVEMTER